MTSPTAGEEEDEPVVSSAAISKVDAILADEDDEEDDVDLLINEAPAVTEGSSEEGVGPRIVDLTVASSTVDAAACCSPEREEGGGRGGILSGVLNRVQQPVAWMRHRRSEEVPVKENEEINNGKGINNGRGVKVVPETGLTDEPPGRGLGVVLRSSGLQGLPRSPA